MQQWEDGQKGCVERSWADVEWTRPLLLSRGNGVRRRSGGSGRGDLQQPQSGTKEVCFDGLTWTADLFLRPLSLYHG